MSRERVEREATANFHNKQIALVVNHIHNNLHKKLTTVSLAKKAVMSRFHFQRVFRDKTGCSVREYISNELWAIAAEDLKSTNMKVKHIQEKIFYESPEAFTRAFTAKFGMTPSKYREQFKVYGESVVVQNENYAEKSLEISRPEYSTDF